MSRPFQGLPRVFGFFPYLRDRVKDKVIRNFGRLQCFDRVPAQFALNRICWNISNLLLSILGTSAVEIHPPLNSWCDSPIHNTFFTRRSWG